MAVIMIAVEDYALLSCVLVYSSNYGLGLYAYVVSSYGCC